MKLYQKLCKHNWIIKEECIVHYPDYEPHKIGRIFECDKCFLEKRDIINPNDYIRMYGKDRYENIKKRS